ncbi:hypothetical protein EON62_06255, partial [archaeon]
MPDAHRWPAGGGDLDAAGDGAASLHTLVQGRAWGSDDSSVASSQVAQKQVRRHSMASSVGSEFVVDDAEWLHHVLRGTEAMDAGSSMDRIAESLSTLTSPHAMGGKSGNRHKTRTTLKEMRGVMVKRTNPAAAMVKRSYTNGDIAQYCILIALFVPHADEEWDARGGWYMSGRATSHEFVGSVVRRLVAANMGPLPGVPHAAPGGNEEEDGEDVWQPSASVATPPLGSPSSRTAPQGGASATAATSPTTQFPASLGDPALHSHSLPATDSALFSSFAPDADNRLAFESLPAALGDLWNESLLSLIYNYYLRAHTDGAPPLYGQLSSDSFHRSPS